MPNINGGEIKFGVSLQTKQNGLKQIVSSLKQVQQVTDKISKNPGMKQEFQQAASAAKKLESIINDSWNDKLNQLNLNQFNQSIKTSFKSVQDLKRTLTAAGPEGQAAFNQMASAVLNTNVQLRESNKLLDSMATSMANTVKWGITSSIFNNITGSIQKAYYYAKDLDSSLNDIRIVTGDSADQMQRFARTANNAAKDLGRSTLDYTKAALTFYQQGLSDDEVKARTEVSLKAQNITGAGSEMYDQLTAVWNGFKVATEDTESIVDKLAAVADNSASNMSQLATAMSKVAATANVVGVDVDQLTAQISTVVAATRLAPESVGTAFKTIYSRINDIKTGADEAQISLGNYSSKMAELGFNVLDSAGNLRDTGQVIEQIGGRWQTLTKQQQVYLAQTMGGQRQITQVMALFDNWDKYLNNLNVSMNSQGTLMEKNNVYLESTQAHLKQLGTQAERTYDILFDQDTVNGFVDGLEGALKIFNDFIDGLGGGANAFAYFGSVVVGIFNEQIAQGILKVERDFERLKANISSKQVKQSIINNIQSGLKTEYTGQGISIGDNALKVQAEAAAKTLQIQRGLTTQQQTQAVEIQKQIGLTQQKIDDLQKENKIREESIQKAQKETGILTTNKWEIQDKYEIQKRLVDDYRNEIQTLNEIQQAIERGNLSSRRKNQLQIQLKEHLVDIKQLYIQQKGDAEGFNLAFQNMIKQIRSGKLDLQDWHQVEDILRKGFEEQNNKLQQIDYLLKNLGIDSSKLTNQEKLKLAALLKQNEALVEQGKHVKNLQNGVKLVSVAGQALTSIGGALASGLAEGATAADKLNATFTGINGTIGAILTAIPGFGPALSVVWQGVTSIGKAILQATGIWDKWEDHFKSTSEKAEELGNNLKENLDKAMQPLNKKKSLEGLKEEFEELSEKAGQYGRNLSSMTEEEQNRYHQIVNEIAQINPQIAASYDAQGNAIVKNNEVLDKTLQKLQREYELQQAIAYGQGEVYSHKDLVKSTQENLKTAEEAKNNKDGLYSLDSRYQISNLLGLGIDQNGKFNNEIGLEWSLGQIGVEVERLINSNNRGEYDQIIPILNNLTQTFIDVKKQTHSVGEAWKAVQEEASTITYDKTDENLKPLINLLNQISQLDYEGQIQQIKDKLAGDVQVAQQEYDEAITSFKQIMKGAVKFETAYNSAYRELKETFGDDFEGSLSDLVDRSINKIIDDLELDPKDIDNWDRTSAEAVSDALTSIIGNIDKDQLDTLKEQLQKLEIKSKNISSKEYREQKIKIIQDFLDANQQILDLLTSTDEKTKQQREAALSILNGIFDVDLTTIGKDTRQGKQGKSYVAYQDKLKQELDELFESGKIVYDNYDSSQWGDIDVEPPSQEDLFKTATNQLKEIYNDDQVAEIIQAMMASSTPIQYDKVLEWAQKYFNTKAIDDAAQETQTAIIENFDKVTSIINKLQSEKDLKQSQKDWLKEKLHLTDEELYGLDANVTTLQAITEKILNLTDQGQKYTGLDAIFGKKGGLKTYYQTSFKKDFISQGAASKLPSSIADITGATISAKDQAYAYTVALQAQQEAIGMNDNQLLIYGKLIGEVTDDVTELTNKQKEAIITHYNNQQALASLTAQAKALAQAGQDIKAEDLSKFINDFKDITGIDLDPDTAKEKIKAYYAALTAIDEGTLENNPTAIQHFVDTFTEDLANTIVENKDKVNEILKSLANGDDLSFEDKGWIKKLFGLTDVDIAQLQRNGQLAKTIFMEAIKTGDQQTQKGAMQSYLNLDTYHDLIDSGDYTKIGWDRDLNARAQAYNTALENSMAEYDVDSAFLQNYAKDLGLVGKSLQQLFRIYQKGADSKSLQQMAENLSKNKDELTVSSKAFQDFKTELNETLGTNYDASFIIQNIDLIVEALKRGISNADDFQWALKNLKVPSQEESTQPEPTAYQKHQSLMKNATAAQSSLQSGSEINNEEQIAALIELENSNAQLSNAFAETKNRYSQEYLTILQQIIQEQNTLLEEERQSTLDESVTKVKGLEEQKKIYEDLLQKHPDSIFLQEQIKDINEKITEQQQKQFELQQLLTEKEEERVLDDDVNEQKWKDLTEYLYNYAAALDEVDNSVQNNQKASEELAEEILRFDSALESVQKNYQNWEQMLTSGSVQDAVQASKELQDVYSDLLDLPFESLSPDFTKDVKNLHLLQQAAQGSEQAYEELQQRAAKDILTQVGIDTNQFQTDRDRLYNELAEITGKEWDDIKVGAELNDEGFLNSLTDLVNAAGMTADQATDYLSTMGIDAEVKQNDISTEEKKQQTGFKAVPTGLQEFESQVAYIGNSGQIETGTVHYAAQGYKYEPVMTPVSDTKENKAFSLEVTSANKKSGGGFKFNQASHGGGSKAPRSSGGGGRGGGGGKPKSGGGKGGTAKQPQKVDPKKKQIDRYHDVNLQLERLANNLQKVQKQQEKLTGKDLIKNLEKQRDILKEQVKTQKEKLRIAQQEQLQLRKQLSKAGATFDENGAISNYTQFMQQQYKQYLAVINKYNAMSAEDQQKYKSWKQAAEKNYEQITSALGRYDDINSSLIPEIKNTIQDIEDEIVDLQVQKFKIKTQLILDTSQAERDFLKFKTRIIDEISEDDIAGNAKANLNSLGTYFNNINGQNELRASYERISVIQREIDAINNTGESAIYGKDKARALEDLKQAQEQGQKILQGLYDQLNEIKQAIYDTAAAAQQAFDKQKQNYDYLNNTIEHHKKLVDLLYGDDAYKKQQKFYDAQKKNNLNNLNLLKQQRSFWEERTLKAQEQLKNLEPDSNEYKEKYKEYQTYKDYWKQSQEDLYSNLENTLQTILDAYGNAVDVAFDKINDKLTKGKGLEFVGEEWELINKSADDYLDKVNSVYEIDKLSNAYDQAIENNKGNLAAQKSLKDMQNEQLKALREKDKLTKYDVQRANLLLQIEVKRLALEQARQNKSKLRLRRDSQGNYTYQYVADESSIGQAQQELADAQNNLWNLDKNEYKNNLDEVYSLYGQFNDKMQELYKKYPQWTDEAERERELLIEQYEQRINAKMQGSAESWKNLMGDAGDFLASYYDYTPQDWEALDQDKKREYMSQFLGVSQAESQVANLAKAIDENGGLASIAEQMRVSAEQQQKNYTESTKNVEQMIGTSLKSLEQNFDKFFETTSDILNMPSNKEVLAEQRKNFEQIEKIINDAKQLFNSFSGNLGDLKDILSTSFSLWSGEQFLPEENQEGQTASQEATTAAIKKKTTKVIQNSNGMFVIGEQESMEIGSVIGKGILNFLSKQLGFDENNTAKFDSGGYTGSWGTSGKIGILHEQELVLNQQDTKNILDAVAIVRSFNDILQQLNYTQDMLNYKNNLNSTDSLDQHVYITANFPNVSQSNEIEMAFNDLINQASQYVLRNR